MLTQDDCRSKRKKLAAHACVLILSAMTLVLTLRVKTTRSTLNGPGHSHDDGMSPRGGLLPVAARPQQQHQHQQRPHHVVRYLPPGQPPPHAQHPAGGPLQLQQPGQQPKPASPVSPQQVAAEDIATQLPTAPHCSFRMPGITKAILSDAVRLSFVSSRPSGNSACTACMPSDIVTLHYSKKACLRMFRSATPSSLGGQSPHRRCSTA